MECDKMKLKKNVILVLIVILICGVAILVVNKLLNNEVLAATCSACRRNDKQCCGKSCNLYSKPVIQLIQSVQDVEKKVVRL